MLSNIGPACRFSSTFHAVAIALLAYLVLVHSNAFNEDSELEVPTNTNAFICFMNGFSITMFF